MIEWARGNLLDAEVDALVNTVNTVGIMGKGLALQFKRRFPENFSAYAAACRRGEVRVGGMFVWENPAESRPRWILNFPTKRHWRQPSRLDDIDAGLDAMIAELTRLGATSVAIPPLGCGNGGLAWKDVLPRIQGALAAIPAVRALVFPPAAYAFDLAPPAAKPLTRARAIVVKLVEAYLRPGYSLTRIEMQKLAYLMQVAGEPLRLQFEKAQFGPFARNLHHVLVDMDGAQLQGVGDGSQRAEIRLMPNAVTEADALLAGDVDGTERLDRVRNLIRGFESPRSMELLATVHWVATQEGARSASEAIARVHAWSERKRERYPDRHIEKAWARLAAQGWISDGA